MFLEILKLFSSIRIQNGKVIKQVEIVIMLLLPIFTFLFVLNQLYYFPLACLFHAFKLVKVYRLDSSVMTSVIGCCLIFLILDMFWFILIVRLLYRVLFAGSPLVDEREYDQEIESVEEDNNVDKSIASKKLD